MLKQRIISAIFMLPLPLVAAYYGSPYFDLLAALIAIVMAWEWQNMLEKKFSTAGIVIAATASNACLVTVYSPLIAIVFTAVVTLIFFILSKKMEKPWWQISWFGVPYVALGLASLVFVREFGGLETILWLLCVVWATDTGAYAFGRLIGGPKLMPKVSPNKTIAGLAGGALCSALTGYAIAYSFDLSGAFYLAFISFNLAFIAQAGDLFESWIKRQLDVKDSSNIIPGHGGFFDRLDGIVAVAPVVAFIVWIADGGIIKWF